MTLTEKLSLQLATCLFVTAILSWMSSAQALEPVGYERWTPNEGYDVVFNQTCDQLMHAYNYPKFFGPSKGRDEHVQEKDYRIIDIEVRKEFDDSEVLDAVIVPNFGDWNRKSWLICDLSLSMLQSLATSKYMVMLDVERYKRAGRTYYAVILQIHGFELDTFFMPSARLSDIKMFAGDDSIDEYMRVVDIDKVGEISVSGNCEHVDDGVACGGVEALYHAVLIRNTGDNHVLYNLEHGEGDGWPLDELVPGAYQLIDRELTRVSIINQDTEVWHSAMLSVAIDQDYHTLENLSQNDVIGMNHGPRGTIIDLEWEAYSTDPTAIPGVLDYEWYVVTSEK